MDNIIILLLSVVFTLICIVLLKINVVRDQVILFVCTLVAFLLFYTIVTKINIHKDNEINIMADLEAEDDEATTVSVSDEVGGETSDEVGGETSVGDEEVSGDDEVGDDEVSGDDEGVSGIGDEAVVNHSLSDIWESSDNPSFHIGK